MRHLFSLLILMLPATLQANETLTVGLSTADYPPYYFVGDKGLKGAAVNIAEDIAAELNYKLVYKRYPWKRVQRNLHTGDVDLVLVYFKTSERAKDVVYTDRPHLSETASLFISSNMKISFNGNLETLNHHHFFGVRGYFYGERYASIPERNRGSVSDESELVRRIANPNFEMIGIGNKPTIEFYARQQGLESKIKFLTPAIFEGYNYFAFSRMRSDADLLALRFSKALDRYMKTKRYRAILNEYGLSYPAQEGSSATTH